MSRPAGQPRLADSVSLDNQPETKMSNTINSNGSPTQRKTLAAQLDRLDTIIDAIDRVLPEVVADAVKQAVGAAVQQTVETVLAEVLSRPELLRALAGQPQAPVAAVAPPAQPEGPSRLRRFGAWLAGKLAGAFSCVSQAIGHCARRVLDGVSAQCRRISRAALLCGGVLLALAGWLARRPRAVSLSVLLGLVVGLGAYLAGPVIASAALGLTSTLLGLAGSALAPLFRLLAAWRSPPGDA